MDSLDSTACVDSTTTPNNQAPNHSESPSHPRPLVLPKKVRRRKTPIKVTPAVEVSVAAMGAAGIPRRRVAKALNISPATVQDVMHRPSTQELIGEMRETIRRVALEGVKGLSRNAWEWAQEVAAERRDPKAFDALARSLLSMEKLSSSASGESRKIEGTIEHTGITPTEELKEILRALRED